MSKKRRIDVKGTLMQNWIYSIWATSTFYNIDYTALIKKLQFLRCKKIVIYEITPFTKTKPKFLLCLRCGACTIMKITKILKMNLSLIILFLFLIKIKES